jgi:hypothetical protein
MDDNTPWNELTTKVFQVYQQLRLEDHSIKMTVTTKQICFTKQQPPKERGTIDCEAILQTIARTRANEIAEDWRNGNVYDKIRYY